MDTNGHELIAKEEVFQIVGCAIEDLYTLGHGLLEKPDENAMAVELGLRGLPFRQQPSNSVVYKTVPVGEYVPKRPSHQLQKTKTEMVASRSLGLFHIAFIRGSMPALSFFASIRGSHLPPPSTPAL